MAKSDTDDGCESASILDHKKMLRVLNESVLDKCNDTTIHSGQFMVSCVHDDGERGDGGDGGNEATGTDIAATSKKKVVGKKVGFNFGEANKDPFKSYRFCDRSTTTLAIDASLTKLFDCMTLAYSGNRLTSPKWKNFKGVELPLKEKIRLNNIIWREWHMQYIKGQLATICQFDPPISDKTHSKPEAVVLEGKYWKRRLECVTAEYKKWRVYYKDRLRRPEEMFMDESHSSHHGGGGGAATSSRLPVPQPSTYYHEQMMTDDDFIMDLTDTLFSSLNQPFPFPNPKELSQLGNADIIQPGLVQLQPNLDDYMMDTLAPLPPLQEMMGSAAWNKFANAAPKYSFNLPSSPPLPTGSGLSSYVPSVKMEMNTVMDNAMYGSLPMMLSSTGSLQGGGLAPSAAAGAAEASLGVLSGDESSSSAAAGVPPAAPPPPPASLLASETGELLKSSRLMDLVLRSELNQIPEEEPETLMASPDSTMAGPDHGGRDAQSPLSELARQAGISGGQAGGMMSGGGGGQASGLIGQQAAALLGQSVLAAQLSLAANQSVLASQAVMAGGQAIIGGGGGGGGPSVLAPGPAVMVGSPAALLVGSPSVLGGGLAGQALLPAPAPAAAPPPAKPLTIIQMASQLQSLLQSLTQHQEAAPAATPPPPPAPLPPAAVVVDAATSLRHGIWSESDLPVLNKAGDGGGGTDLRRASTGSVAALITSGGKRDGSFLIPQSVTSMKSKPRSIAPAPLPKAPGITKSPQQSTYLAQLLAPKASLIEGYAPAGVVSVKTEQPAVYGGGPAVTFPAITMAVSHPAVGDGGGARNTVTFTTPAQCGGMNEFQRNVLIAATSQAIRVPAHHIVASSVLNCCSAGGGSAGGGKHESVSPGSSPQFHLPTSPVGSDSGSPGRVFRLKSEVEKQAYKVNRRASHTSAEQKRRYNIKSGFDTLHQLVPALTLNMNAKVSKAAKLQKTADYCRKLKQERVQMQEEAELLRREIEVQNNAISACQSQLPATGVPVKRQRVDQMCELLDDYVTNRTRQNWKFWIFSILIQPLFDTFNSLVSTASVDELCRTVLVWLDRHCSLVALRPAVLNSLRHLSTTTSILSDPSRIAEQAAESVRRGRGAGSTGIAHSPPPDT